MIPLFVDLHGRHVVIFGGGKVASRKARYFSRESEVTVVSRSFAKDLFDLSVRRHGADTGLLSDDELTEIISPAFLVVAALSDPGQNNRIGRLCRAKGILFNNADGETGDVIIPSAISGKNYTVAISTLGDSPAVSRFIREHLESDFPGLEEMITLHRVRIFHWHRQDRRVSHWIPVLLRPLLRIPRPRVPSHASNEHGPAAAPFAVATRIIAAASRFPSGDTGSSRT